MYLKYYLKDERINLVLSNPSFLNKTQVKSIFQLHY